MADANTSLLVDIKFSVGADWQTLCCISRVCFGNFVWQLNLVLLNIIENFCV